MEVKNGKNVSVKNRTPRMYIVQNRHVIFSKLLLTGDEIGYQLLYGIFSTCVVIYFKFKNKINE